MLARFLKDGAVYTVAAVLSRGIAFLLLPLYTRVLAPGDYGVIDMVTVLASLANLVVALEISQGFARHYSDATSAEDRISYASTALWFTVAAYAAFWVAGALGADVIRRWVLDGAASGPVVHVALAWICANGIFYLVQNQLRWQLRPMAYAVASLTLTVVTLLSAVALVGWARLGVLGVLWAQVAGSVAGCVVGFALARGTFRAVFDARKCRRMLSFSLPLVPSSAAVFVALYVDRIAIKELMTMGDVGTFGVGYRLASIAGFAMVGFQGALTPLVYQHHASPDTPPQLARIFRYFTACALLLCALLSVFAREIVAFVADPAYAAAAGVVPLLAPAVLLANMYIFAPGLAIAKRTGVIAVLNVLGATLNVALNLVLVPVLGIQGAALATLLGAGVVFAGYMLTSQREYPVPHAWGGLALGVTATALAALLAAPLATPAPPVLLLKTCLLLGVAALLVLAGVVRTDELQRAVGLVRVRLTARRA